MGYYYTTTSAIHIKQERFLEHLAVRNCDLCSQCPVFPDKITGTFCGLPHSPLTIPLRDQGENIRVNDANVARPVYNQRVVNHNPKLRGHHGTTALERVRGENVALIPG